MNEAHDRSAYPHPDDFKVMRPEYIPADPVEGEELEEGAPPPIPIEDVTEHKAIINVAPFKVEGTSATRAGARRAALYEAEKIYRSYHPAHKMVSPYPHHFMDQTGAEWKRLSEFQKELGDYSFKDEEGEDYTDIETMLLWDIRVKEDKTS